MVRWRGFEGKMLIVRAREEGRRRREEEGKAADLLNAAHLWPRRGHAAH